MTTKKGRIIKKLQEELESLNFEYKYVVFDLEATVRERDSFKMLLEKKMHGG